MREPLLTAGGLADGPATLDLDRIERVSAGLRKILLKLTPEFVAAAEDFCREVIYIPASALGTSPIRQETGLLGIRPRDVKPRWAAVPLLYVLARWGGGLLPVPRSMPAE